MRARSVLRRRATEGGPLDLAAGELEAGDELDEEVDDVEAVVEALEVLAALLLLPLLDTPLELPLAPAGAACIDGPA